MNRTRKSIRLAIIGGVLLVFAVAAVLHFSIEPADYAAPLSKQVEQAQALLDGAEQGNGTGQYTSAALARLRGAVEDARALLADEDAAVSAQKAALQVLRDAAARFPEEANAACLSAEELVRYREQKGTFRKTVTLDGGRLEWAIECRGIDTPAPVNLTVTVGGAQRARIEALLTENKISGLILSFAHEGRLPGRADITLTWDTPLTAAALYHYQADSDSLRYVSTVSMQDGSVRFSIAEGGDWVLCSAGTAPTMATVPVATTRAAAVTATVGSAGPTTRPATPTVGKPATAAPVPVLTAAATKPAATKAKQTVTVSIRCDMLLSDQAHLKPHYAAYVPRDGVILAPMTVELYPGESAFDVLKRVTRDRKIAMTFQSGTAYGGMYIESIGNLDKGAVEGDEAGWMFRINGRFPNYGCNQYTLKDGDLMEWVYTCNLGQDVGDLYDE